MSSPSVAGDSDYKPHISYISQWVILQVCNNCVWAAVNYTANEQPSFQNNIKNNMEQLYIVLN